MGRCWGWGLWVDLGGILGGSGDLGVFLKEGFGRRGCSSLNGQSGPGCVLGVLFWLYMVCLFTSCLAIPVHYWAFVPAHGSQVTRSCSLRTISGNTFQGNTRRVLHCLTIVGSSANTFILVSNLADPILCPGAAHFVFRGCRLRFS